MTNTERKLDEARYFLGQLNLSDPYFDYILSAFLNAARSTTWIMRHEFCEVEGWETWFNKCDISIEEKSLLKKINELRILSTKQTGVKTEYYLLDCIVPEEEDYPVIKEMFDSFDEGDEFKITIIDDLNKKKNNNKESFSFSGKLKTTREESEISRESINKLCADYFIFLQKQVDSCIIKFNK